MRKFFSDKAGATFNFEMPTFTYAVRKNCIELIYKLNRGCYAILNLQRAAKNQLVLTANWHHYFNRIQNPAVQYPKIEKCCPNLYTILKGDDPDGVMQVESTDEDGTKIYGFGMLIEDPQGESLPLTIDNDLMGAGRTLVNKVLAVYRELYHTPPFPAWKTGLEEIWN